ncbi:RICIN domain-containing protein [Myceligenerans crystallogenes]|uniref:Ricin B lectin domain-containing protein n=1 Tax=Myceligenerans crystallogenes TaxID=316335 RepID=A0ABN2N5Z8_9MICO
MYDAGPPARPRAATVLTWVVAGILSAVAVVTTAWVLTHDVGFPRADARPSPSATVQESGAKKKEGDGRSPAKPKPSPAPSPSPPPPAVVTIAGAGSERCLDVPNAAFTDGAALQIYDCNDSVAQQWTITATGELRVGGTKCLDDASGGSSGVPVAIHECHGGANQRWSSPGDGSLRSVATGLCLDVEAASEDNGARVQVYECHFGDNQLWDIG